MSKQAIIIVMIILIIGVGLGGYFMLKEPTDDNTTGNKGTGDAGTVDTVTLNPNTTTNSLSVGTLKPFDKFMYDANNRITDPIMAELHKAYLGIKAIQTWQQWIPFVDNIWKTNAGIQSVYSKKDLWFESDVVS